VADPDFTPEQVDLAIDYVARQGAQSRGSTVTYTHVFEAAGMPDPQQLHKSGRGHVVTELMEAFHHRCVERACPPLDSLVINATGDRGGLPGIGYFRVNRKADPVRPSTSVAEAADSTRFWEAEKESCRAWGIEQRRARRSATDL
jgi:hypothetical protein